MSEQPPGPTFEVHVDEQALAEDLSHASDAARSAIEPMIQRLKSDGVPAIWLKRCSAEARDGTRLPGCVKLYLPQPAGQWGAVFVGAAVDGKLTVYELAHRRLHVPNS